MSSKLNIVKHTTWEEAAAAAHAEAAMTMATTQAVILFEQGGRQFMVTSFPMAYIADRVRIDDLKKGEDPDTHYNRPLIPEHYRAIGNYLATQDDYILPSITLCIEENLNVHSLKTPSTISTGMAVLPQTVSFIVTDGQHRIRGIQEALKQSDRIKADALAVMIVNEEVMERIHQDFVDCAQTKAISPALLTAFNVRDPLAKLVREVASHAIVFKDRIEKVGTTVGKNSIKVFTMNQLRAGVAELLIGNSIQSQAALRKYAMERLTDEKKTKDYLDQILEFYRKFAKENEQWTNLVLSAEDPADDKVNTYDLRQRYLHFMATGLVIIGRVGHQILQMDPAKHDEMIRRLAQLDWSREAAMWQGNVVTSGKVNTQNNPVTRAVMAVKKALDLQLTVTEIERERRDAEATENRERVLVGAGSA